jgi:hypothetical protein
MFANRQGSQSRMLLHGEEQRVCLQMDEQIVWEVLLRTAVKARSGS